MGFSPSISTASGKPGRDVPAGSVPAALRPFLEALTKRLREGLRERLIAYSTQGHSLAEIGSPETLAERMLDVVPEPSRWDDLLGPFYGTRQVARLCGGISRQAVADRRERGTLLGLKTADGALVYPTCQFDRRNRVLPGLPEVIRSLRGSGVDDWTLAGWLVAPLGSLGGESVIGHLRRGGELEPVLAAARDAARRFAW